MCITPKLQRLKRKSNITKVTKLSKVALFLSEDLGDISRVKTNYLKNSCNGYQFPPKLQAEGL